MLLEGPSFPRIAQVLGNPSGDPKQFGRGGRGRAWRMAYVGGPEGIVVSLAERIG
jgi:hypothetical protein